MSDFVPDAVQQQATAAWVEGIKHQIGYWVAVIRKHAGFEAAHEQLRARCDPQHPMEPYLDPLFAGLTGRIELLDLGCGAVACTGWVHPDLQVKVTSIDSLALVCGDLMHEQGFQPPTQTIQADPETVADLFPFQKVDAVNGLALIDNCRDPVRVLRGVVEVLRPGGRALVHGVRNDGERCGYYGTHQWNAEIVDGDLSIWRPGARFGVRELLAAKAQVSAFEAGDAGYQCWITKAS